MPLVPRAAPGQTTACRHCVVTLLLLLALPAGAADLLHFWDEPRRGANSLNQAHIATAFRRAASHDLAPNRVVGSEFGCVRRWADCGTYLEDVIDAVESLGGHWAFYAFREDE